ncbi:MAG: pyrimidine/purine nucleoside phosphorylase [Rudaea sp.]
MPTETLSPARVSTKANIFSDGRCVSHTLHFADGSRKTVGVILPSTLVFNTGAAEVMEGVAGECEYRLDGNEAWSKSAAGESFSVPANTRFEIRTSAGYHYICHFG